MNNRRRMTLFNLVRGCVAILMALLVAAVLIFISSDEPLLALRYLILGPVLDFKDGVRFNLMSLYTVFGNMIPIMFTGLGVCVMFSANEFNCGGEGCVMAGAFTAALCAIYVPLPGILHPIFCVTAAMLVCGCIMLLPALLKVKLGASEMVCTLMLNYVVLYVVKHFLTNVFADRSKGQTQTARFLETAQIQALVVRAKFTWGFFIALACALIIWVFMYRTRWGYTIRMLGVNKDFSRYSGLKVGGTVVLAQVMGGMLSGMGGSIEMLGRYNSFKWNSLPGYGWDGMTVAILAKNNPAFVPLAAFFIAYLDRGCQLMATSCDISANMIDIIQAVIFLFFAAEQFLAGYRQKLVVRGAREELLTAEGGAKA